MKQYKLEILIVQASALRNASYTRRQHSGAMQDRAVFYWIHLALKLYSFHRKSRIRFKIP